MSTSSDETTRSLRPAPAETGGLSARAPLGIYDSGLGGLTVLREVQRQLPQEAVVYFADTAHVPYGHRSAEEILEFNRQILRFLAGQGVKLAIAACNTSSALALPVVRREFDLPVVGMIEGGAELAAEVTRNGRIGLLATESTVRSGAYVEAFRALDPALRVYQQACPRLVPLIEAGQLAGGELRQALAEYLAPLQAAGVDTVVLGCTHYPLVAGEIRGLLGEKVALVDPAVRVVQKVRRLLAERGLLAASPGGRHL
ncbi:MAG: glutamate racemase, partial [Bacillota bacterium]|nr:glutamate racemase [Bacillota bacterium]